MITILILVMGFVVNIEVGDRCEDALHTLTIEEGLQIVASDTIERDILTSTLSDGVEKTAILGCRRDRPAQR